MNIGRVLKAVYLNSEKKEVPFILMDIRTITVKKEFTVAVNKLKYSDGKISKESLIEGKESLSDYCVWYNTAKRGESLPSSVVGGINNVTSKDGVEYKTGFIFDLFVQKEPIVFSLFAVKEEEKQNENHLYNVVANITI